MRSGSEGRLLRRCACADSGLGRATPPRRAASPGLRALASPAGSGPGSLPGAIGKRRHVPQDDHSDVSSTHSSIMDYSGKSLFLPYFYSPGMPKMNKSVKLRKILIVKVFC